MFLIQISAIYLRGGKDIFFYEFLQEICGDKLAPFIVHYSSKSINNSWKPFLTRVSLFRISSSLQQANPRLTPRK